MNNGIERLVVGMMAVNCYIIPVGVQECVVVDPGDEAPRIEKALEGLTPRFILLTHGHFDHIGAAAQLRERLGCPVVIGELDAPMLADPALSLAGTDGGGRFRFSADRLVKEGDAIQAGDAVFTVLHTPGHTPGGVCYLWDGKLFCGDTLFQGSYGRTDFIGGDGAALRDSLKRLAALPPETLAYPGHGDATDIKTEQRTNPGLGMAGYDDLY